MPAPNVNEIGPIIILRFSKFPQNLYVFEEKGTFLIKMGPKGDPFSEKVQGDPGPLRVPPWKHC